MSIQSAPFYWIVCDDCGRRSTEHSDIAAWSDEDGAREDALAMDWTTDGKGAWLCVGCGPFCPCGVPAGDLSGERDYLCPACWVKEVGCGPWGTT